jgi:hypothetical protein
MYSEIALSQKSFGIGHMYMKTFLLRIADTMTSQIIDLFSWDTLYICYSNKTKKLSNAKLLSYNRY